jgi:parvulin-like peptidyl-prolyl isomerase
MDNARFLIFIAVLFLAGCGAKPKFTPEQLAVMPLAKRDGLPEASGGFALVVGDQTITAEDVIGPVFERLAQVAQKSDFNGFKQLAGPVIEQQLVSRISDALLYSKARKEAGEQIDDELDRATTAEVRKFVMDFGGDYAKAEQALKQMGMDWGRFEQYKRRWILSQSYLAQQLPKNEPITYGEMTVAYDETKNQLYTMPAVCQFRLIDIEPARMQVIDPNKPRRQQAKDLAERIAGQIKQGEDFEKLARDYSHDHRASAGGLWRKVDPASLAPPYDVLAKKAESMRPGQVTDVIENQGHFFIMQLVEFKPKSVEPFEKVQSQVKARIAFDRLRQALDKLNNELLQQASAADKSKFVDFCVREIYRMANK